MAVELKQCIALVATLGIGLLAGTLAGTGLAEFTARHLPEASWTMRFQLEDSLFARVMPPFMLSTLVALGVSSTLAQGSPRWLFGASVAFMLLVLAVTIVFEVPLNKQIQSWTPGSAPHTWQSIRDLWLRRHLLRTIAAILSFISALLALMASPGLRS